MRTWNVDRVQPTGRDDSVADVWPPHDNPRGLSKTVLAAVGYLQSLTPAG